jgi:hypothetical protein
LRWFLNPCARTHKWTACMNTGHNVDNSSNWDSRSTGQLGYKHTLCQNFV